MRDAIVIRLAPAICIKDALVFGLLAGVPAVLIGVWQPTYGVILAAAVPLAVLANLAIFWFGSLARFDRLGVRTAPFWRLRPWIELEEPRTVRDGAGFVVETRAGTKVLGVSSSTYVAHVGAEVATSPSDELLALLEVLQRVGVRH